ncbi:unnamed protein product [Candida verbasci]|uniref:25S rRNA (Uridine(2843)-N(3))-methyltransferase n=1 Tax=Candida verbasci TaxID=1227364 RepID=A0A9W4X897_9ASCO|nr:unnamed protein product [Candida verbasci]
MNKDELSNDLLPFTTNDSLEPIKILDLIEINLKHILNSPELQSFIQIVKGDLYNRDYLSAFNSDEKRFAYVARWTPARALSYSSLFSSLKPIKALLQEPIQIKNVLCIGGGAGSELIGLSSVFCRLKEYNSSSSSEIHINIIDIANWSTVINHFTKYIKENWLYHGEKLSTNFICDDILITNTDLQLNNLDLITILFTTNELFTEKRKETIKLLQKLNDNCKSGTLLLIAESAGSYSHIIIGERKFPIQFLIDTILVGKPNENNGVWEIVNSSESCWYRINQKEVEYSMKLENMRFFYRLYRKK